MAAVSSTINAEVKNSWDSAVFAQITFAAKDSGEAVNAFPVRKFVSGKTDKYVLSAALEDVDLTKKYNIEIYTSLEDDEPVFSKSFSFGETNAPKVSTGVMSAWSILSLIVSLLIVVLLVLVLGYIVYNNMLKSTPAGSSADPTSAANVGAYGSHRQPYSTNLNDL